MLSSHDEETGMWGEKIYSKGASRRGVEDVVRTASAWEGVTTAPHQFDAVELRLSGKEFGHFHRFGVLDVPFTKKIRDSLIAEGLADVHPFVPDSGWISFRLRREGDVERALWLLRLSYLYRSIQHDDAGLSLEKAHDELASMVMSDGLRVLFESALSRRQASLTLPNRVATN